MSDERYLESLRKAEDRLEAWLLTPTFWPPDDEWTDEAIKRTRRFVEVLKKYRGKK